MESSHERRRALALIDKLSEDQLEAVRNLLEGMVEPLSLLDCRSTLPCAAPFQGVISVAPPLDRSPANGFRLAIIRDRSEARERSFTPIVQNRLPPDALPVAEDTDPVLLPDFIARSGRALAMPVYAGTYERRNDRGAPFAPRSQIGYRDNVIEGVLDLRRSHVNALRHIVRLVDAWSSSGLQSRPGIDCPTRFNIGSRHDNYQILSALGKGGMSEVLRGLENRLGALPGCERADHDEAPVLLVLTSASSVAPSAPTSSPAATIEVHPTRTPASMNADKRTTP